MTGYLGCKLSPFSIVGRGIVAYAPARIVALIRKPGWGIVYQENYISYSCTFCLLQYIIQIREGRKCRNKKYNSPDRLYPSLACESEQLSLQEHKPLSPFQLYCMGTACSRGSQS